MSGTILYVAASHMIGGGSRSLLTVCEQLAGTGLRPHVVVPGEGPLTAELARRGVPFSLVGPPFDHTPSKPETLAAAARHVGITWRLRPALVHANSVPCHRVPALASRLTRIPVLCHVRYHSTAEAARYFLRPAPAALVFNSRAMRAEFPDFPGRKTCLERVIYNGFDPDAYEAPEARGPVREAWGSGDRVVVGILGNFARAKGHERFLEAAGRLVARGRAMQFVVVGDDIQEGGRRAAELNGLAEAAGLGPHVVFAGFAADVARPLAGFDLLVVPSLEEPFGRVAVEGLLAGLPVVASDVGGLPEVLDGCDGARLVAPDDAEALAAGIEALAARVRPDRRAFAGNRAFAAGRFANRVVFRDLLDLYGELGARPA
jgi:glycosyltransferase involved in cell wall biosynthesis